MDELHGEAWERFAELTGMHPDPDPIQFELACAMVRLRLPELFQDKAGVDLVVEQTRESIRSMFGEIPEPARSGLLAKLSLKVPASVERRVQAWTFPDGSCFARFSSRHWSCMAPLFERAASAVSESDPAKPAISHTFARIAYGCSRKEALVPLSPLQAACCLRALCEPGELRDRGEDRWRTGTRVFVLPHREVSPEGAGSHLDEAGILSAERAREGAERALRRAFEATRRRILGEA